MYAYILKQGHKICFISNPLSSGWDMVEIKMYSFSK